MKWSQNPKKKSLGFDAFSLIVGDENIVERRFVTRDRTMMACLEGQLGNPVDW